MMKTPENVPDNNVGKINGKTPEEIKKGLEYCFSAKPCADCEYDQRDFPHCVRRLLKDAIDGHKQLESRLAQAERERDAAVEDLSTIRYCSSCKYYALSGGEEPCCYCDPLKKPQWQWCGVPENTKEES